MKSGRLPSYLRAYRKKSGLTLRDMASLLGSQTPGQFFRYEQHQHIPSIRTAFAFEAILKVPVAELFAGIRESVEKEIEERMQILIRDFEEKANHKPTTARRNKLRWLRENHTQQ
jgi:transcriptional regulator with XRE-family HTH domain